MARYDEVIRVRSLNAYSISVINAMQAEHPEKKFLVEIPDTKGSISQELLKLSDNIAVRVAGSYDRERVEMRKGYRYTDGETGRYYVDAVIYSKEELYHIINVLEKIEHGMQNLNLSDFEKVVFLYGRLKNYVMYDPLFESKLSKDIRSLRGLITRKSVCAGFAVIFKELLDRQGIECKYVEGLANGEDAHAWNIVTIDGKNYPIDVTWDNANYRSGKTNTYDFFAKNVKEFQRTHVPYPEEPTRRMKLSEVDSKLVEKVSSRFAIENQFHDDVFLRQREDGSRFILAQVGDETINGKKYYRYYYADVTRGNKNEHANIFYGETNVSQIIDSLNFGYHREFVHGLNYAIDDVLFAKKNIEDSMQNHTNYLGSSIIHGVDGDVILSSSDEIRKSFEDQKQFDSQVVEYQRANGSTLIVQKMENDKEISDIPIFTYHVFELVPEEGEVVLKRNIIYTE